MQRWFLSADGLEALAKSKREEAESLGEILADMQTRLLDIDDERKLATAEARAMVAAALPVCLVCIYIYIYIYNIYCHIYIYV